MREIMLKEPVELKLPAQQNMMLVLRLTTAGVIARAGLTVDKMDDVKLAVEEACSCLIGEGGLKRLKLTFSDDQEYLRIRICGDGDNCCISADSDEMSVVRCILESLVDGVDVCMNGNAIGAIELRIALCM